MPLSHYACWMVRLPEKNDRYRLPSKLRCKIGKTHRYILSQSRQKHQFSGKNDLGTDVALTDDRRSSSKTRKAEQNLDRG